MNTTLLTINGTSAVIHLTRGKHAVVDLADHDLVAHDNWQATRGRSGVWYATRTVGPAGNRHSVGMHRVLCPGVAQVDHRDGDGLNNRRANLRAATAGQNRRNSKKQAHIGGRPCTSRYKGVTFYKRGRKWVAQIRVGGKNHHLGYFDDELDAAQAYDAKALEMFGVFARVNFPLEQQHPVAA